MGLRRLIDTAGMYAPGAPGGDTGSGCPSDHTAQQDQQSHQPVAMHSVGLSYPTTNGPFRRGRPPLFLACPPASQRFPHPAGICRPITSCPGALTSPQPLPWEARCSWRPCLSFLLSLPCSLFSLVSAAHISMIDCV